MIRTIFKPDLVANKQKIAFKFILGSPPDDDWRYALEQEEYVSRLAFVAESSRLTVSLPAAKCMTIS